MGFKQEVHLTDENALRDWRKSVFLRQALNYTEMDPKWTQPQAEALFTFYRALKKELIGMHVGPEYLRAEKLTALERRTGLKVTTEDGSYFSCDQFPRHLSFIVNLNFFGKLPFIDEIRMGDQMSLQERLNYGIKWNMISIPKLEAFFARWTRQPAMVRTAQLSYRKDHEVIYLSLSIDGARELEKAIDAVNIPTDFHIYPWSIK